MSLDAFARADLDAVLGKLDLDEKIALLAGADWWTTVPVPRLGIPAVKCSDGPNGVRGKSHFNPTPATCLPCATALGASFDVDLLRAAGGLLARECAAKAASLLLGPTVNIQRNPLNGRAFESFAEDPFLSGHLAAAYIGGLQDNGVGACIKHFVGNDMEDARFSVDVRIPERALREIYLMPFMIAQKLAKPWAFMTSYSRLNGLHASENARLLKDILRGEWAFDGMVMSDWNGTYSTTGAIVAGLDMEMPGPTRWRGVLAKSAHFAGKLSRADIDARARAMLQYIQRCVRADRSIVERVSEPERVNEADDDKLLNRKLAADAIVLLKNDRAVLPLAPGVRSLAVIGPNAKTRTVSGGGSAYLTSSYVVTPYEGLCAAAESRGIDVRYAAGCYGHKYLPMLDGWMKTAGGDYGWTTRYYNDDPRAGGAMLAEVDLFGSRLRINDEKPAGLAEFFYVTAETYLTAPTSGAYDLGLSLCGGRGQLYVDGAEVVDNGVNRKQTPGTSFYGLGTIEETGTVAFEQGKTYKLELYYTSVPVPEAGDVDDARAQPPLIMAALRVGCAPRIDAAAAIDEAVAAAVAADAVVAVIGTNMDIEAEASDRPDLELPGQTNELIARLLAVRPDTVIVNQSGSAVTFPWIGQATTVVQSWFGGNETGRALADVLFGDVNPAGRMPLSFPYHIEDCTAHLNWGCESGAVLYGEGIFVGYRGYEETRRDVMFAFGEGLSYTTFEWSPLAIKASSSADAASLTLALTVTNTGARAGADVVQVYITDKACTYRRPKQELKAFAKVVLAPGESKEVSLALDRQSFAFYNDAEACWVAEKGAFVIAAKKSSREMASSVEWELTETLKWTGL